MEYNCLRRDYLGFTLNYLHKKSQIIKVMLKKLRGEGNDNSLTQNDWIFMNNKLFLCSSMVDTEIWCTTNPRNQNGPNDRMIKFA